MAHEETEFKQSEGVHSFTPSQQALHDEVLTLLTESENTAYWVGGAISTNPEKPTFSWTRMYLSEDANTRSRVPSPFLYNLIPRSAIPAQPQGTTIEEWKEYLKAVEKYLYQLLLSVKNAVFEKGSLTLKPEIQQAFQAYLLHSGMSDDAAARYMNDPKTPFRIYEFFYFSLITTIRQQSLLMPEHTIFYGFLSEVSSRYKVYQDGHNICMQYEKGAWDQMFSGATSTQSRVSFLFKQLKVYLFDCNLQTPGISLDQMDFRVGCENKLLMPESPGIGLKYQQWAKKAHSPLAKRNLLEVFMLLKHINNVANMLKGCVSRPSFVGADVANLLAVVEAFLSGADNNDLEQMFLGDSDKAINIHDFIDQLIVKKSNFIDLTKLVNVYIKIPALNKDEIQAKYSEIHGIEFELPKLGPPAVFNGHSAYSSGEAGLKSRGTVLDAVDTRPNPLIISDLTFPVGLEFKMPLIGKILIAFGIAVVIATVVAFIPPAVAFLVPVVKAIGIKSIFTQALTHASVFSSAAVAATKVALGLFSTVLVGASVGVAGGFVAGVKKLFGKCFGRKNSVWNERDGSPTGSLDSSVSAGSNKGDSPASNGSPQVQQGLEVKLDEASGGDPSPGHPIQAVILGLGDGSSSGAAAGAGQPSGADEWVMQG